MEPLHPEPNTPPTISVDLTPPPGLNLSLWRSLWQSLRDRFHPEVLPPLQITAKPVNVGMSVADRVSTPWYRTILSSLGDLLSPESLPPLELESHPVEVDDLISDQLGRGWWTSLLRNLADRVAPEKQAPLHLTSAPVKPADASTLLNVPQWSALIDAPKFLPQSGRVVSMPLPVVPIAPPSLGLPALPEDLPTDSAGLHELTRKAKRSLQIAHLREAFWIATAGVEVGALFFWFFLRH